MHHPTDKIAHTTVFVTPVVVHWLEREIAQWVHPMKDRSDDPLHHERTLLPQSYISLPSTTDVYFSVMTNLGLCTFSSRTPMEEIEEVDSSISFSFSVRFSLSNDVCGDFASLSRSRSFSRSPLTLPDGLEPGLPPGTGLGKRR